MGHKQLLLHFVALFINCPCFQYPGFDYLQIFHLGPSRFIFIVQRQVCPDGHLDIHLGQLGTIGPGCQDGLLDLLLRFIRNLKMVTDILETLKIIQTAANSLASDINSSSRRNALGRKQAQRICMHSQDFQPKVVQSKG